MKISAKTMAAVKRAAADQQMTVDAWAEKALARAAVLGNQSDMEAVLGDISRKLNEIAERQTFVERTNEQLATAVKELGTSFDQIKKRTGSVIDQVRSRTGSAVSEIAERAKDVIGQVSRTTTDLAGSLGPKATVEDAKVEEAAEPQPATPRKRKAVTKRRTKAGEKSGRARRRGTSPGKGRRRGAARRAT